MFYSTESDCPSLSSVRLVERALMTLKQSVATHLEHKTRLERLCVGWQKSWTSQCDELKYRIDVLEARLAPWMTDAAEAPRLAVVLHQEDAA